MIARPFIQMGVAELEKLFDQKREDRQFLKILVAELSERKTQRAQDLLKRAVQAEGSSSKTALPKVISPEGPKTGPAQPSPPSRPVLVAPPPLPQRPPSQAGGSPMQQHPSISNRPTDVLSAWTAMEVLSPPTFRKPDDLAGGDRYRIASIETESLPWQNGGERSRPNQKLYYQVVLGSIDMDVAVSSLLKVYADSRDERPPARGEAVLAVVMLDKEGRPVETDPVSIASFGWGVPVALSGRLRDLGQWTGVEKGLLEGLTKKITVEDKDGNVQPLNKETIRAAYNWLIEQIAIDRSFVKPPAFAVRSYQYFKIQDPPESILLNSFFLDDLAKANALVGGGQATPNMKRYLGMAKPAARHNLMQDNGALINALLPKKFPLGSWPASGRHPLVLLQQCAVNLAFADLEADGILAVNGPPGTGKTTLLRDAIAAIVTKRAEALCTYEDPEDAFIHSGQKLRKGNAFVHLYKLKDNIRGHEIIVASSNNKAVENVSAEVPGIEAIARDATTLRYFKSVSDSLLQKPSWGMIAAVLGNAKNRSEFRQTFWWDQDSGMQPYLQEASGNPQFIVEKTEDGAKQRKPRVILDERPPEGHDEALQRWKKARARFRKAMAASKAALADLQTIHDLTYSLPQKRAAIAAADADIVAAQAKVEHSGDVLESAKLLYEAKKHALETIERHVVQSQQSRPGFWSRLFGTESFRSWKAQHDAIVSKRLGAKGELGNLEREVGAKKADHAKLLTAIQVLHASRSRLSTTLKQDEEKLSHLTQRYPGVFISDKFFELRHAQKQGSAPWLDEATAKLRNDVFESAMGVHRAFIDAAAKPVRHNLNTLMDGFGTRSLGSPEKDALIPHLWSTLFLLVPVVSTTFASVSRMFSKIGPAEFGWLLVDEAGQALPQAAVGALMRTKRAIVVGDPIQIEPVVVLPDQLTEAISRQFGIDPLHYNAPGASAQTLADSATGYFGTFETKLGTREVGVPLLVHRRCAEPMFSISNSIAYENLMVQAKAANRSEIRDVLGPSQWFDVEGPGQEKWCQREGETLLRLLRQLRDAGCAPDFYIVTPFVVVQDRMRAALRSSGLLDGWVENPYSWVYERVGTVHTVQGREAEAVFFILGAPDAQQRGARGWAGGRPNLLNVAVTRAKEAVYVIGNRKLWKSAGFFQSLDDLIG